MRVLRRLHRDSSPGEWLIARAELDRGTVLPPREIAFWWWLRGLPPDHRLALVTATSGGVYDDVETRLLDQASVVLGCQPHEAHTAVTAVLERRLVVLPPEPQLASDGRARGRHRYAAPAVAAVVLLVTAATALAGTARAPVPVERTPVQVLPRPLARPLAHYEDLAVVPGRQWDLPDRGGPRSAPPWLR